MIEKSKRRSNKEVGGINKVEKSVGRRKDLRIEMKL